MTTTEVKQMRTDEKEYGKAPKNEVAGHTLVPGPMLEEMSESEKRGLSWLSEILDRSSRCSVDKAHKIVVDFNGEADLVFDIPGTIYCHRNTNDTTPHTQLIVSVRAKGSADEGPVCVVSKTTGIPITDHCASFILWAENGFYHMPSTVQQAIDRARGYTNEFVRDLYSYAIAEVGRMPWRDIFEYCESFDSPPEKLTLERAKLDIATTMADPEKRGLLEGDVDDMVWEFIYGGDYYESKGGT